MENTDRRLALRTLLAVAACLSTLPARAQQAAPKLIKIIAPVSNGATFDQAARVLAHSLGKQLGSTVIVENRAGAGGTIGTRLVVNAAPDGATLLLAGQGMISIAPHVMPNLGFDPIAGLVPVAPVGVMRALLVVAGDSPIHSVADLVQAGHVPGGTINFGSGGNGSGSHLMGEMLNARLGTHFQHVAYQGISPMVMALAANQVQLAFVGAVDSMQLIKSGKLRAIACPMSVRDWQLPDVPTLKELGYGDDWLPYWVALFAPRAVPAPVVAELRGAMTAVLKEPSTIQALKDLGMIQDQRSIEEFTPVIAQDSATASRLIKSINLKP